MIVGAGEVGYHVIGSLYREGVEIVAVDSDPAILETLRQEFNIRTIQGNAIDSAILKEACVDEAELFVAVTNYDETNIISCLLAGEAGVHKKIARVKTIDFGQESSFSDKKDLGIDLIINPYEVAAEHLASLVANPQVTDYTEFLSGRLQLLRVPIAAENPIAGRSVLDFGQQSQIPQTLIALIQRKGQPFIPSADEIIQAGDEVYFFCERSQKKRLFKYLKLSSRPSKRVYINGGGHIGFALAKRLEKLSLDVRILEISEEQCEWLSQYLDKTLVLHEDGSDSKALQSEGIEHADFFISVTAEDQINVVSCMLAKLNGASKVVALTKQPELIPMLMTGTSIDIAFSPRLLTARNILRFVRGHNLESFFMFPNSDIELLELKLKPGMRCNSGPISDLNLPSGVLIGAVKRGDGIFVPRGNDHLAAGDTIMLLQQRRNRRFSRAFFLDSGEPNQLSDAGAATQNGA
ncbi:MAG: Trk system potassium transporter TrkA [SAR324 cluster bacterium]|nr:Trk system potassium transporter TrkA [SAR324 cluster bacterium]MCZ6843936.1 Trk system potassium transporter TrkA [SAR324 cluster bacterium]